MEDITYQWKIDFALILSLLAIFISFVRWYFERRTLKKNKVLQAYEKVFDDAIFILLYPLKFKKELAGKKQFNHSDPEFEKAVRKILNTNMLRRYTSHYDEIDFSDKEESNKKLEYFKTVYEAASKFENEIMNESLSLSIHELSPINYFDNELIKQKFENIIQVVGKNLSLFSPDVQKYWSDTIIEDPDKVKLEYENCLEICANYFTHNPREFPDPFYDLLTKIRDDYRRMTRKKFENFGWKTKRYFNKIIHPIKSYKYYKEMKYLLT